MKQINLNLGCLIGCILLDALLCLLVIIAWQTIFRNNQQHEKQNVQKQVSNAYNAGFINGSREINKIEKNIQNQVNDAYNLGFVNGSEKAYQKQVNDAYNAGFINGSEQMYKLQKYSN